MAEEVTAIHDNSYPMISPLAWAKLNSDHDTEIALPPVLIARSMDGARGTIEGHKEH